MAGVEIIRGPETVTNATVGGIAKFVCIINSESDLPWWNIDGYDIDVTNLPPGLQFESNGFSKILTVNPVLQVLNNSCFYCYLLFYDSRIESLRAKLIIQPPTISHPMSSTKTAILSLGSSSAKHNILSPTYIHSTWQNISAPAEKSSVYVIPQTSQYYLDTTPMSSIRQVTPISSVVILTPWYLLHQNLICKLYINLLLIWRAEFACPYNKFFPYSWSFNSYNGNYCFGFCHCGNHCLDLPYVS